MAMHRKNRSKYSDTYPEIAYAHLRDGGTIYGRFTGLAPVFGVTENTIDAWRRNVPEFREAIERAPDVGPGRPRAGVRAATCSVGACELSASKVGYCNLHYGRWRKYGSTEPRPNSGRAGRPTKEENRKLVNALRRESEVLAAVALSLFASKPKQHESCVTCGQRRPFFSVTATPEADRSRRAVAREIAAGRLVRPGSCEECGKACRPEAAHYDYKPENALKVRFLCKRCHNAWDHAEPKGGTMPKGGA